jgi:hypothetical protein
VAHRYQRAMRPQPSSGPPRFTQCRRRRRREYRKKSS